MWNTYPLGNKPVGWIELSENGWGAVIAWLAGPENVVRKPVGQRKDLVRETCTAADGSTRTWTEPITEADVRGIEDDIDFYLADAGLPPRPRGFHWFLGLPAAVPDEQDFWRRIHEADSGDSAGHPDLVREVAAVGEIIKGLYAQPVATSRSPGNNQSPPREQNEALQ